MYIDSQAVIQASMSNRPPPGHYLLDEVHEQYRIVQKIRGNMEMTIRWSPGHSDIPGNEAADEAARRAAEGDTTATRRLPRLLRDGLPHSKSAARQTDRRNVKEMAIAVWKRSTRYARIDYLVPGLPRQNYFTAIAKLSRKHTSIITQLVTGHIPLAKHLHRINKQRGPGMLKLHGVGQFFLRAGPYPPPSTTGRYNNPTALVCPSRILSTHSLPLYLSLYSTRAKSHPSSTLHRAHHIYRSLSRRDYLPSTQRTRLASAPPTLVPLPSPLDRFGASSSTLAVHCWK